MNMYASRLTSLLFILKTKLRSTVKELLFLVSNKVKSNWLLEDKKSR
jgi:hypothetical protein